MGESQPRGIETLWFMKSVLVRWRYLKMKGEFWEGRCFLKRAMRGENLEGGKANESIGPRL